MNEQQLKDELISIQRELLDEIPSAREARMDQPITDKMGNVQCATISVPYGWFDGQEMWLIADFEPDKAPSWSGYALRHDPETGNGEVSDPDCLNDRAETARSALLGARADADIWYHVLENESREKEEGLEGWEES